MVRHSNLPLGVALVLLGCYAGNLVVAQKGAQHPQPSWPANPPPQDPLPPKTPSWPANPPPQDPLPPKTPSWPANPPPQISLPPKTPSWPANPPPQDPLPPKTPSWPANPPPQISLPPKTPSWPANPPPQNPLPPKTPSWPANPPPQNPQPSWPANPPPQKPQPPKTPSWPANPPPQNPLPPKTPSWPANPPPQNPQPSWPANPPPQKPQPPKTPSWPANPPPQNPQPSWPANPPPQKPQPPKTPSWPANPPPQNPQPSWPANPPPQKPQPPKTPSWPANPPPQNPQPSWPANPPPQKPQPPKTPSWPANPPPQNPQPSWPANPPPQNPQPPKTPSWPPQRPPKKPSQAQYDAPGKGQNQQHPGQEAYPTPPQSCEVDNPLRVPCGGPDISPDACMAIHCCSDRNGCYYGKAVTVQCTKDASFIVVAARDATLPNIDLESMSLMSSEPGCTHVDFNSLFAIYHFPVTACGSVVLEDQGAIIYENKLFSSYEVGVGPLGSITRDSYYEVRFQCRYLGVSVETLMTETINQQGPDPIAPGLGPIQVELRLGNGVCTTKGCDEVDVAYDSYYADSDYPVAKVLRDPVYIEVRLLNMMDPRLILTLGRCWTTTHPNPHSLPQWDILIDGCPNQGDRYLSTLIPIGPSSGLQFPSHYKRFIFQMFTFVDHDMSPLREQIYIHCSTEVCTPGQGESCDSSCGGKRTKRNVVVKEPRMVMTVGPLLMGQKEEADQV